MSDKIMCVKRLSRKDMVKEVRSYGNAASVGGQVSFIYSVESILFLVSNKMTWNLKYVSIKILLLNWQWHAARVLSGTNKQSPSVCHSVHKMFTRFTQVVISFIRSPSTHSWFCVCAQSGQALWLNAPLFSVRLKLSKVVNENVHVRLYN